jgi:non-ribosomal peptide synthetase component E (peptide arylation enzyme)
MTQLLHELPLETAQRSAAEPAVRLKKDTLTYSALAAGIESFASAMTALGLEKHDRVGH